MEEIEKYIFDPENPKAFKAYGLLKKIIKDKNNVVFIDPYFFGEIFHDEIFDRELVDEIWDKPNDFDELSGIDKMHVLKGNYAKADVYDSIEKRIKDNSNKIYRLFDNFIVDFKYDETEDSVFVDGPDEVFHLVRRDIQFITDSVFKKISDFENAYSLCFALQENRSIIDSSGFNNSNKPLDSNIISFVDSYFMRFPQLFPQNERSNIAFVKLENERERSTLESIYEDIPKGTHPIFLKKPEDIHKLFNFLLRDLKIDKSRKSTQEENIPSLSSFHVQNYFSLKSIKLEDLQDKREIYFLGENGDGKTLLLQSIVLALVGNNQEGEVIKFLKDNPTDFKIEATNDKEQVHKYLVNPKTKTTKHNNVFGYGINRFRSDAQEKDEAGYLSLFSSEQYLENPIQWLIHLDHKELRNEINIIPLRTAKKILRDVLEENVEIEVTADQVYFTERGTKVTLQQLSDGYKSVIVWVCDLLARLSEKQPNIDEIQDFQGIVLVDEIGAFLHPKWQLAIAGKLRNWFPKIQFIFTTHSPIVLLGASKDAVFYKVYKENGETKISESLNSIADLTANTILTSPLFGLESAVSKAFDPKKDDLKTEDNYLTSQIHKAISEKLKDDYGKTTDEELFEMIRQEINNLENEQST
ncbi:MAG: putative ATP-binding protein involved in virulence [Flammeovirgaceae bacterium]|jgi:predicted ATP-binding protein involved in virulence